MTGLVQLDQDWHPLIIHRAVIFEQRDKSSSGRSDAQDAQFRDRVERAALQDTHPRCLGSYSVGLFGSAMNDDDDLNVITIALTCE